MTVDLKTQLRDYTEFFASTVDAVEIEEILQGTEMAGRVQLSDRDAGRATQTHTPTKVGGLHPRQTRSWRKPVLAFVFGLLVILIATGGIAIWVRGDGPDVTDEPTPTTQAPAPTTTTPTPTTITPTRPLGGPISAPSYAAVPSYTGVVQYYQFDPGLGDPGWQATVSVSFAGPMRYEAEVIAEEGEPLFLGGAGKVYLGDGTSSWLNEFEGMPLGHLSGFDHFRHLYYDSDWPSPPWDEICAEAATVLGGEAMLGRTVTHVACSTAADEYELWVDEESGLVLRMAGSLEIGDYHPSTQDGGFAFTELTFEPVTISDPPDALAAQTGEFPPFHMIRTGGQGGVEYWYRDADTLRETRVDGDSTDSFTIVAGGRLAGCNVYQGDSYCYDHPIEDARDLYPLGRPYSQLPVSLVEESCTEVSQDSVGGRPARYFVCDGVSFPKNPGAWIAAPTPGANSELWYDTETDLLMKWIDDGRHGDSGVEVTLLEVNPAFPVGIFVYEPPGVHVGDVAPPLRGPTIGGGEFDMADYRHAVNLPENGSVVVVFKWSPECGPYCLEGLDLMQQLYDDYGQTDWLPVTGGYNIEFVTVIADTEQRTAATLSTHSIDVRTVYCQEATCTNLWDNSIPSITVVDGAGQVEVVYNARPVEYEVEIEALLATLSGNTP